MGTTAYDPFAPGGFAVGVRTVDLPDPARDRTLPGEVWYPALDGGPGPGERRDVPALPGAHPLVVYSHHSGGDRRCASFLGIHLAGHGYVVAAPDHSEVVVRELGRPDGDETAAQRAARVDAIVAARVPDVRLALDAMLAGAAPVGLDPARIGLVGHSFGGWTVLATPDVEPRVAAVVAHAPGGSLHPRPGILPLGLDFAWGRDVPTLYLAGGDDVSIPADNVRDVYRRTPGTARMVTLCRADHQHFADDVEIRHEAAREMTFPGDAAWIPAAMRPIDELCSGAQAHLFVCGLTVAHLDATLRRHDGARRMLAGDLVAELAARGVAAVSDATTDGAGSRGPGR